jgi:hypothetical protein
MKSKNGITAATLVVAGLLFAPFTNAQTPAPDAPAVTTPGPSAAPIPDKKLDAAAAAAKKVVAVSDEYEQKIARAPEGEKQRLTGEAKQATLQAVADQGLSIAEYATIRDRLMQRLK